jgi:FkbH-like protein
MITYNELIRSVREDSSEFRKVKIAVLADSASQLLCKALRAFGLRSKLDFGIYEAGYNQIDAQVLEPSSELYSFNPDFIYIDRCSERLLADFYTLDKDHQIAFAEQVANTTQQYYNIITSRLSSKIIINTFPGINDAIFGNFSAKTSSSFIFQLRKTNVLLMEASQRLSGLFVCDIAGLQAQLGQSFISDPRLYSNADMGYSLDFLPCIAKQITDIILAVTGTFNKCLILDLDNIMWGGMIGDDGIEGIEIADFGPAKIFAELQTWARQLKQRGIILAVCSKNTESIAMEPFLAHPDMVLRLEDIAVFVANWDTKVNNIRHIQSVLNIGFDSMVFLDDSAFERELVRSAIPEITVPELPEDPAEYLVCLRSLNLFETAGLTEEDVQRTNQYQQQAQRNMLLRAFDTENNFLASLDMQSEVVPFNSFNIPRVAQLSQRSNQFNLRTIRYTQSELQLLAHDPDCYTLSFSLRDRLGNYGLIAVVILKKVGRDTLFIDSWLMSCRVLNRGMEGFTLNIIMELARENNFKTITGEYLPTAKNTIVKDLYKDLGFKFREHKWMTDVANYQNIKTFINSK